MKYELWGITGEEYLEPYTITANGGVRTLAYNFNAYECELIYELYSYNGKYYPTIITNKKIKNKRDIFIKSFESNHALSTALKYEYNDEIYDIEDAIYKDDTVQLYTNIEFDVLKLKDDEKKKLEEKIKIYNQRVKNKNEEILKMIELDKLKRNKKTLKYWIEKIFK